MTLIFRIVGFLEGISYILLMGVGMPLKYFSDDPSWIKALGMPHGLLFVAYIILAYLIKEEQKWSFKDFGVVCLASVIPFGTFYIDRKYLSKE